MAKVYQDTRARKRGGVRPWIVAYVGLDGKRHRKRTTATTKEEARAILRQRLSAAGRQTVEQYDWSAGASKVVDYYAAVASSRVAAPALA